MKQSGIIPLGKDQYVEVFTVGEEFELWMVEEGSRKKIGRAKDMIEGKILIEMYRTKTTE